MSDDFPVNLTDQMKPNASKFCNRSEIIGADGILPSMFLAKLWAVYGSPAAIVYEGFDYQIQDRKTGIIFQAYSGASGPAYCFSSEDFTKARDIVERFENLIAPIQPADCEITVETDFGDWKIGYKDGKYLK